MKSILANLGFIFQIAGLFVLVPILTAFYYNELDALISFFITSFVFFGVGFLLNALAERKELSFKSSCVLASIIFFLLGLVGSIPYLYLNTFSEADVFSKFTNSYFEAVSGQTTTGYSFIENVEALPKSLILYKGLSQWTGGLGLLLILLTFLYPEKSVLEVSKVIALTEDSINLKKSFVSILAIQLFYIIFFILLFFYAGGLKNIINVASMSIASAGAGGVEPVTDFAGMMTYPNNIILSALMLLAATSFTIHYKIFTLDFKTAFTREFFVFIIIILVATALLSIFQRWDITSSFFHVVSTSSSAGYNLLDFSKLGEIVKLLFIFLMFIGGCSLSPAGGIKVVRLLMFLKSIPWVIKRSVTNFEEKFFFGGRAVSTTDVFLHISLILLAIFMVLISTIIFMLHRFPLIDSLFESVSAFTNTGIPGGLIKISIPIYLKWWIVFLMVLGRIEIIPLLIAISPYKQHIQKFEQK